MAGLQGAGKTTTVGKLAKLLVEKQKKKVLVVSCDVYRPAAIEQLKTVAAQAGADCFPSAVGEKPVDIARNAVDWAKKHYHDVLLVDTAGRLAIDEAMMREITELHAAIHPIETLFVVDAMLGQDAINTAKAFGEALPLTGVVLTKLDGDSRGGAALSVRHVTGKPIKYAGVGEKLSGIEPFHPERMASRILGMGDVLSLIEEAQKGIDAQQAVDLAKKLKSGKGFDLNDFKEQIGQMRKMGGITSMMDKLPAQFAQAASHLVEPLQLVNRFHIEAQHAGFQRQAHFGLGFAYPGKHHARGVAAGGQHALQFATGHNVKAGTQAGKVADDRQVGVGFQRKAHQVVLAGKGIGVVGKAFGQRIGRIDKAGRAKSVGNLGQRNGVHAKGAVLVVKMRNHGASRASGLEGLGRRGGRGCNQRAFIAASAQRKT